MNHSLQVVDSAADRPIQQDRGDSAVEKKKKKRTPLKGRAERQPRVRVAVDRRLPPPPRRSRKQSAEEIGSMTDEELMAEAGVSPIYSTTEAAEFFDRSNQWIYWGLRNAVFTDDRGLPLQPERIGDVKRGRRRFTLDILEDIMRSSYRRGNFTPDQMTVVMRRIKYAQNGVDWREREGWRYVHLGKSRYRWVHPDLCEWDPSTRQWHQVREWARQ
jgi:hypothetical protein